MKRSIGSVILMAVVAASCSSNGNDVTDGTTAIPTPGLPVTYTGPDGVTSTVTDVSRIVTLSGEFTEIIYALGLGDNIVAVDLTSVYPPEEVKSKPKIGVEFRLLAEPIIAQEPTVVIGDEDAVPKDVIEQVRAAEIPVVIFPALTTLQAPTEKIRLTAHVLGIDAVGEELASRVQAEIDEAMALAARATTRPRVAFVYVASDDTILIFGEDTVGGGLMEAAGAINVATEIGIEGWVPLTPEALAAGAPEAIITASRGFESVGGMEGFLAIPGVSETPAGRDRNILVFEDLYVLGLASRAGQVLMEVVVALHPELESTS